MKIAVNVRTEEEEKMLMKIYEKKGWIWNWGKKPTEWSCWYVYREETYIGYDNKFTYCNKEWCKENDFKIISFQDLLLKELGLEEDKKICSECGRELEE